MRGHALTDPTVVGILEQYIVTHWHGHRDSPMPDVVAQEMSDSKLHSSQPGRPAGRQRNQGPRESNVFLLVIDPSGRLVHAFDGFPSHGRVRGGLGGYVAEELEWANQILGRETDQKGSDPREIQLPDLPASERRRGARALVTFEEDRMRAYRAPVIETAALDDEVWETLASGDEQAIDANLIAPLLKGIYPPGVMDRTNPETKFAYQIARVEGKLTLTPKGSDRTHRYSILKGRVTLTDEGPDDFHYSGDLEIVIACDRKDSTVDWFRGTFDGIYPRFDRHQDGIRKVRLTAALESLPAR